MSGVDTTWFARVANVDCVSGKIGAVATLTATVKDGPLEVFSTFVRSRQKREGLRLIAPVCRKTRPPVVCQFRSLLMSTKQTN